MRPTVPNGAARVLQIFLVILAIFLVIRLALMGVTRYHNARGSGKRFKRALAQGRLDAEVYEDAIWDEVEHFGRKRLRSKISKRQQRAIRAAKAKMREDFLDDCHPGFYQYVIIFLLASVLGLILETIWMLIAFGVLESRVGLVWGPFSPLYGLGAVILTAMLWPLRKKRWYVVFPLSMVAGGSLEQFAGWAMEYFAGASSWSYLHLPDHITQWVAVRFLFMWGALGVVWCKAIMPELMYRIGEITSTRQMVVVSLLTIFMSVDILMTFACFYRADQRRQGHPAQNVFEQYVDSHFDDDFISSTFENLTMSGDEPPSYEERGA